MLSDVSKATTNGASEATPPELLSAFAPAEMHDRVVIMLLFDQIVTEAQVRLAWAQRSLSGSEEGALWRWLPSVDGVDTAVVYAEAARVYGFQTVRVDKSHTISRINRLRKRFDLESWYALLEVPVVPIDEKDGKVIFATHDPTSSDVRRMVARSAPRGFELRHADREALLDALERAEGERRNSESPAGRSYSSPWFVEAREQADSPQETEPTMDRPTFIRVLEGALVAAVRKGASAVCLFPTAEGDTQFFVEMDGTLRPWYSEQRVPARVFMAALKSYILEVSEADPRATRTRTIERWVDGKRTAFEMQWVAQPKSVPSACACIRIA